MASYFAGLSWQNSIKDIIDIVVVSYVIYKIILLVRDTRAVQLLKGIVVLVATWALSTYFNLLTLKWLMQQIFSFGVLALIIIFQPELRRALEQLGRGKLFSRGLVEEDKAFAKRVGEVIQAVNHMARKRIGAIIVFERQTGLNDYIESGVAVKSQLSAELLITVFTPTTPLHDGAIIVRGNEIMAAGCYLPLSENPFISKELGTRHRAGIGMSEVSDALSIIVSEETGKISFAMNGQLVRDIKEESLISKLYGELKPKVKQKEKTSFWKLGGGKRG